MNSQEYQRNEANFETIALLMIISFGVPCYFLGWWGLLAGPVVLILLEVVFFNVKSTGALDKYDL